MKCPRCQHENRAQAKFCEECATPLSLVCSTCSAPLSPTAKFCPECAHPVAAGGVQRRFASPDSYTPQYLAEKILTSKSALEGERKQVTILFADLKGSMELLADRDPEEARKILDPVLERMIEAVHHYEGTVNQVMGDGIMALFGAPVAHEDHAVRACYAALRMQRRITLYADEIQRVGGTPPQVRIGLNSGEVVVRAIGSDLHMDYTAVGQTTHLAARMEQMAKPGTVLVASDTVKLAEGYVQIKPLGKVPVKGVETPTPVYELTGIVPARSRLQVSATRGLTRFVGRDGELQLLARALERAAVGHGQVVAVVGEAGVGKSRLVWEFAQSHRTHDWLMLESASISIGKATPYLPVIELLKAYCRIQERDDSRAIRERVAGKLIRLDLALEALLTPLLALLDVPVNDTTWEAFDPPQRRQRTLEAVKRLLLRESQVQPLLVVFEDLHWIDSETQALLDGLIESLPAARVLLLVTFRPEYEHAWGRKTYYLQLRIDALPPEDAEALLHALLSEDRTLEPLKRVLIDRTEGNPFFLEESVRTLVETQVLVGERGAYRMARPPDAWQIPATAQAMLAARIDRLPPEDKRLLQSAAVIGPGVPFVLLHAIAGLQEEELRRGLMHLQAAEFLYETNLFPDLEYKFKHALTHEVAYGGLLKDRRRELHARIVEALERLYPDRQTEHIEQLAHHAVWGELWGKAVTSLRQAGAKSAARSANRDAVSYFEQALVALSHLPEGRTRLEQAVDLRIDLRNALWPLGENHRMVDLLVESEALAQRLNDRRRLGWIYSYMGAYFWLTGDLKRARECGEQALGIAVALADTDLEVPTNIYLGLTHYAQGDYPRCIEALGRNVASLAGERVRERFGHVVLPSVSSRHWLVRVLVELGRFAKVEQLAEEALAIAEAADQPVTLTVGWISVGFPPLFKGEAQRAIPPLERALALCQTFRIPLTFPWIASHLGNAYALSGRVADAIPLLEQAVEHGASWSMATQSWAISSLGDAYLLAGRSDEAEASAARALRLARDHREQGHEAYALRLAAEIAAQRDPPDIAKADDRYREALTLATELGMRPLAAHCHLGLGKLDRRAGKRQEAQEHLTTATTMYREMDMGFWLEQAEVEMGGLA